MLEFAMEKIEKDLKLARGVLLHNDCVLLVQDIRPGQGHYFLPGGNVEPGESIQAALPREWMEELGWDIRCGAFLGCLEHKWAFTRKQDGAVIEVLEMNFLFAVEASKETLKQEPLSKEPHLKFSWVPIETICSLNLMPTPLKNIIPAVADLKPTAIWASTI